MERIIKSGRLPYAVTAKGRTGEHRRFNAGDSYNVDYERQENDEFVFGISLGSYKTQLRFDSKKEAEDNGWVFSSCKSIKSSLTFSEYKEMYKDLSELEDSIRSFKITYGRKDETNTVRRVMGSISDQLDEIWNIITKGRKEGVKAEQKAYDYAFQSFDKEFYNELIKNGYSRTEALRAIKSSVNFRDVEYFKCFTVKGPGNSFNIAVENLINEDEIEKFLNDYYGENTWYFADKDGWVEESYEFDENNFKIILIWDEDEGIRAIKSSVR